MTLGELFGKEVVTAAPSDPIADVANDMARRHVGAVVVVEDQVPVGIVTDRDIALAVAGRCISRREPIRHIMTSPVTTINQKQGILAATRLIRDNVARRLPIVDDQRKVVGLVSVDDLMVLLGIEISNLTNAIAPEVEAANVRRSKVAVGAV
jgi:CBS domain-containing protein